jgi:hypothetical protein
VRKYIIAQSVPAEEPARSRMMMLSVALPHRRRREGTRASTAFKSVPWVASIIRGSDCRSVIPDMSKSTQMTQLGHQLPKWASTGPSFLCSQRWMISAGIGRRGRPAQTLSRACTASRWYPSTWFNNGAETSHDSRLLSAYLSVASAAKEARFNAPQRSDGGALIACFQAAVAALRSRTSSGHGVCAST